MNSKRDRALIRAVFGFYRFFFSPLFFSLGAHCRFEPSCSHYGEEALSKRGWVTGGRLLLFRVLRCHPFAKGGLDRVPEGARR